MKIYAEQVAIAAGIESVYPMPAGVRCLLIYADIAATELRKSAGVAGWPLPTTAATALKLGDFAHIVGRDGSINYFTNGDLTFLNAANAKVYILGVVES